MTAMLRTDRNRTTKNLPHGTVKWIVGVSALVLTLAAHAGPLNPDCTAEKAAKSAAMKATVGVGGRCSPKEAAADTAKGAAGMEEKGPLDKNKKKGNKQKKDKVNDNDKDAGLAKKGMKKMLD